MGTTIDDPPDHVRLHITPFNKEIYDRIIPPSLASRIANVSLHAVQTFPERGFGYVDMPRTEADKLKKKLNGTTLKGTKIRIEEARPVKKRKSEVEDVDDGGATKRRRSGDRKSKAQKPSRQGVITGHELEEGRHVKRAWTEPSSKDKRGSKATKREKDAEQKLLFRTTLPPNVASIADPTKSKVKSKVSKDEAKKKRSGDKRTIVKEFAHHRTSFAVGKNRSEDVNPAVQYIDGKGWVDEDGTVVEAATRSARTRSGQHDAGSVQPATQKQARRILPADGGADNISADSSSSGDGVSERSEADSEDNASASVDIGAAQHQTNTESQYDQSISAEDEPVDDATKPQVHPLEALYKRKSTADTNEHKLSLAPIDTSFSFFGSNADDDGGGDARAVSETYPQTPHTKQEFEWRAQRSAAPTPDTAAIDGRFGFPFGSDDDDDDDDEADEEVSHDMNEARMKTSQAGTTGLAAADSSTQPEQEESAFRKYFYAHRGENDRAWKKKRREAKKQERQRENRRLTRRVV